MSDYGGGRGRGGGSQGNNNYGRQDRRDGQGRGSGGSGRGYDRGQSHSGSHGNQGYHRSDRNDRSDRGYGRGDSRSGPREGYQGQDRRDHYQGGGRGHDGMGHRDSGRGNDQRGRYSGSSSRGDDNRSNVTGGRPRDDHSVLIDPSLFLESSTGSHMISSLNVNDPESPRFYGSHGASIAISSNYFRIVSLPGSDIYHYNVTFSTDVASERVKSGVVHSWVKKMISCASLYVNGNLYVSKRLPQDNNQFTTNLNDSSELGVSVIFGSVVLKDSSTYITILNNVLKRVSKSLGFVQVRRNFYDNSNPYILRDLGIEVWPGTNGSIKICGEQPLFCADVSHHIVRCESARNIMRATMESGQGSRGGDAKAIGRSDVAKEIIGKTFMTRYNNKSYKISDIDWDKNPLSTFKKSSGEEISYVEYYEKVHNIQIQDTGQPLLVSTLKERRQKHIERLAQVAGETVPPTERMIHLIPELCFSTGIPDELRTSFHKMKAISDFTRISPGIRCSSLQKFVKSLNSNPEAKALMQSWGLDISDKLITLPGRMLPPEKAIFGKSPDQGIPLPPDIFEGIKNYQVTSPIHLEKWCILTLDRDVHMLNLYVAGMKRAAISLGINISDPLFVIIRSYNARHIAEVVKTSKEVARSDILMFLIPNNRKDVYDIVKVICCVEFPIPSQVIVMRNASNCNKLAVLSKVVIQMSVKLGAEAWRVAIPLKNSMVVGIDVCHDPGNRANSWLGFVSSTNSAYTKYYSRTAKQPTRTEVADSLSIHMKAALMKYTSVNGSPPHAVVVFRDGVGDGQMDVVRDYEVNAIRECLKTFAISSGQKSISLTYVIVRKRINTKLFYHPIGTKDIVNPPAGTIIDQKVTINGYPNFYLVPQTVNQGTVNPTHYIVVSNDNFGLPADRIQRLSFMLCHLYYNWTGAVRVPAPCQYAHKLCFLVSQSVRNQPSEAISNNLYFL